MYIFRLAAAGWIVSALAAQSQPDTAAILGKVSQVYSNAKQYRFAMKKTGEEAGSLEIAVQKPNRFRFEADGRVIDGADDLGKVTMVSDGGSAWNFLAETQQYTRKKTTLPLLDTEPPEITPETFALQADAVFLTRYAEMAKAVEHARLLRQEIAQGANCFVIELQAPLPGYRDTYTWWVDARRFVILREDTKPVSSRRPASSVVYTFAAIDEPLPENLFHFTPPPGARQVERLE